MKNLLIILFVFSFTTLFPRLKIKEIRTSSNDVLVVLLHNSDNSLFGREFDVNEVKVDNISEWKINNEQVSELYRYSTKTDIADHHIYLKTNLLQNNKFYKIVFY